MARNALTTHEHNPNTRTPIDGPPTRDEPAMNPRTPTLANLAGQPSTLLERCLFACLFVGALILGAGLCALVRSRGLVGCGRLCRRRKTGQRPGSRFPSVPHLAPGRNASPVRALVCLRSRRTASSVHKFRQRARGFRVFPGRKF